MKAWKIVLDILGEPQVISTIILIACVFLFHRLARRAVFRSTAESKEIRRRWLVNVRNATLLLLAIGLVFIWGTQLRTLAVSLVAFIAAIILATKELILCISGTVVRGVSKSFRVGDRIEIQGLRGDVIDHDLLTTTLLEVGPGQQTHQHTGRILTIPNALFLNNSVFNECKMERFLMHHIVVPVKADEDWRRAERLLLEAAGAECAPYIEKARGAMHTLEKSHGLDAPPIEPRIILQMPDAGKVNLVLRIPAPFESRGVIEQAILRRYLDLLRPPAPAAQA